MTNNCSRSTHTPGKGSLHAVQCNLSMAQEAHGITAAHLVPPTGDRVPQVAWGPVVHHKRGAQIDPPTAVTPNFVRN